MVVAGVRMQRMSKEWAVEKKIRIGLLKGLENVRRRRREREAAAKGTTVEMAKEKQKEMDGADGADGVDGEVAS